MAKVLVVDDDRDIIRIAETRLRIDGYQVLTAEDGERGLEVIRAERPDVVLMDLMMPKLHGFALLQEVRKDPSLNSVYIIITSAKSYPTDMSKAKELGANGYLTKPYDLDEMAGRVRSAIEARGGPLVVRFWGTRGSIPTPGPSTPRYGGNTSCVEVRCGDSILMFDCGSGAREMGMALNREFRNQPLDIHLFISHTHWDHIQGFPFFLPAYATGNRITIYSLRGSDKSLEKVFTGQMDASYFPVALADLGAKLTFVELDGVVTIGSASISHVYLNHPGLAIGFRVEAGGKSVVYLSDHEPYSRMSGANPHNLKLDEEVTQFARGTDLYIREAQYTEEEYCIKKGWGHSVWKDAMDSAHAAGVRALGLFHHDPMHDDAALDAILEECREYARLRNMRFRCFIASDNMEVRL